MSLKKVFIFILQLVVLFLPTAAQTQENLLTAVLQKIFANIFKPNSMSVSIITNVSGHEHFKANQKVLDPLIRLNKEIQVPVAINQYTSANLMRFIQAKLIFSSSAEYVKIRVENHNKGIQSIATKYIIVLNTQDTLRVKLKEIHEIFQMFYNYFIVDVVVLTSQNNFVEMYTYKPYSSEQCSSTKPLLLQRFTQIPNTIQYQDLYPEKTRNFHQCAMKVVLWHLPPFVELKKEENSVHYAGLDVDILRDLEQFLNFSIEFMPNEPENYIGGTVFSNQTAVGAFKLLAECRANLSIGFIACGGPRRLLTTGSVPYFINEMVILVKNSQKYTPLQLLLRPFNKFMWCLLISTIILKIIFGKMFCMYFKIPQTFHNLLTLQWVFMFFIVRICYEGSMFKAIRSPPHQPLPRTLDEFVAQNYVLVSDYASARILSEIALLQNITTVVPGDPHKVLKSIDILPPKTGVLTFNAFLTVFMQTRQKNFTEYATIREKVANTMICVFFPQFSMMASSVDSLLRRHAKFGMIEKFAKDHGFQNLPATTEHMSCHNKNAESPLDFSFLKTVFWYYFLTNIVAIIVFLLELLAKHSKILNYIFIKVQNYYQK